VLEEVKRKLLESPESIQHILETFDFDKVRIRNNEIRCAFEHGTNPTAVVIRLRDNDSLFVKDYRNNTCYDLITYLVKVKNIKFKDVLNVIKQETGIVSLYNYRRKVGLFGGLYDNIKKQKDEMEVQLYPEEVLQEYGNSPNLLWLQDGISLAVQRKWNVGYDVESQRITFPIRTPTGEIMAIKGRANFELSEFEPKYLYLYQGPMSQTLFGFSENFESLYEGDILIFESEKSVLKLDSWGYNNAVALGSNSLSTAQSKLLMSLNPRSITFMLDNNLPLENTKRNVEVLQEFCKMRTLDIKFWNWEYNFDLDEKAAPCDGSKEEFVYILENEIEDVSELMKIQDELEDVI
jgi:DNA primase